MASTTAPKGRPTPKREHFRGRMSGDWDDLYDRAAVGAGFTVDNMKDRGRSRAHLAWRAFVRAFTPQ